MNDRKPPKSRGPGLNREIQAVIGEQLRRMHDEVVKEGIPDRFVELLKQLDKNEKRE